MSAAHCFEGFYSAEKTRIRAGTTYRNTGGAVHYVDHEILHPDYKKVSRYDADISVIKLASPLIWSDSIKPGTILPQNFVLPDNHPVTYVGWGQLAWGGPSPTHLQHVNVYTINNELCAQRYTGAGQVTKNMICAGVPRGGRDACQMDSGGPLYAQGEKGPVIVGVISWGYKCGDPQFPGISTSVASYSDWIVENAR